MTVVLTVAILVGASPARSAVRPAADFHPGTLPMLTPVPLGNWLAQLASDEPADAIPLHPASGRTDDTGMDGNPHGGATAWFERGRAPLFVFLGIGAILALFVALLMAGRKPPQDGMA